MVNTLNLQTLRPLLAARASREAANYRIHSAVDADTRRLLDSARRMGGNAFAIVRSSDGYALAEITLGMDYGETGGRRRHAFTVKRWISLGWTMLANVKTELASLMYQREQADAVTVVLSYHLR